MSHLQPFSIDIFADFSKTIVGFTRISAFHRPFFQEATAMESTTAVVTVVAFTKCLAPKLICFYVISHSNWVKFIKCSAQCFSIGKNSKGWGKGWTFLLLNCWTQQRRFFFQKTPTKLKETTTSKTVSFCWCNICTESFGIRFLYLRPSTTCDL